MRKITITFIIFLFYSTNSMLAQSNNYPSYGDVTIRNYSPQINLQRSEDEGGFTAGIQTKLMDGTNSWYFGNLHSYSWIVSAGDYQNPKLTILSNGNVGIGTPNPSNLQGWSNVLDVAGAHHAKILATAENSTYKMGIFSHNPEWYGGGGFVGTESNHNLHFITNYNVKMSILTNGNVGIGITSPDEKLTVKGKIHTQEVRVDMAGPLVPDYVFADDYKLKSLQEIEDYVKEHKHLPEIPSAKEIEKNGLMLAEMNMSLLKKIEEMTLYMIEMKKENEKLKNNQEVLEKRINKIENK